MELIDRVTEIIKLNGYEMSVYSGNYRKTGCPDVIRELKVSWDLDLNTVVSIEITCGNKKIAVREESDLEALDKILKEAA